MEEIGRGGMGVVYRAEDLRLRRPVALKFLHDPVLADPAARARLLHEARAASGLDDPNICTIFELAETPEGETFFAMAYYAGETLAQRLKRGPIPLGDAWQIAVGITRGLAAAHAKGIVHRDLTPRNVILPSRGTVRILDFGLAGAAGETGSLGGIPAYMPPEVILGTPTGMTGDVWTLGVTLYELFTGQRPFTGRDTSTVPEAVLSVVPTPPRKLNSRIPEALDRLILRMLEKDPAERPADAGAVREALEPILERYRWRRTRCRSRPRFRCSRCWSPASSRPAARGSRPRPCRRRGSCSSPSPTTAPAGWRFISPRASATRSRASSGGSAGSRSSAGPAGPSRMPPAPAPGAGWAGRSTPAPCWKGGWPATTR